MLKLLSLFCVTHSAGACGCGMTVCRSDVPAICYLLSTFTLAQNDGRTPLDIALAKGNVDIAAAITQEVRECLFEMYGLSSASLPCAISVCVMCQCTATAYIRTQIDNRGRWGRRRGWITACIELYIDREATRLAAMATVADSVGGSASSNVNVNSNGNCNGGVGSSDDGAAGGRARKSRRRTSG